MSGGPGVSAKGENFGWSLAVGDFDHDLFDDLAIGVPGEAVNGVSRSGALFVAYGTSQGLSPGQFWQQQFLGASNLTSDNFAWALASGDFNNDGFADLAIGTPGKTFPSAVQLPWAGRVYAIFGSASRLTSTNAQTWHQAGPQTGALYGSALASADFDLDGNDDLAIGAPGFASASGAVVVLRGAWFGLTSALGKTLTQNSLFGAGSETSDNFGFSLGVGDYNNDGFADLAIGVCFEDIGVFADAGEVNVSYGTANGLGSTKVQVWNQNLLAGDSPQTGDRFGASLSARPILANGLAVSLP